MKTLTTFVIILVFILLNTENGISQSISWDWATSEGSSTSEYARAVAVDASGNRYVAGNYEGSSLVIGGTPLPNNGDHDIFLIKYDPAGNVEWVKSAGANGYDNAKSLEVDNAGNVYMAGYFSDTIVFGNIMLRSNVSLTNGSFIVKYDPAGNVIWAKCGKATSFWSGNEATDLCLDNNGNVYLFGRYEYAAIFDNLMLLTSTGAAYIVKIDSGGTIVWAKSYDNLYCSKGGIALDSTGNIYITGLYYDEVIIDVDTLPGNQSPNFFVAKLHSINGKIQWIRGIGGTGTETSGDIAVSLQGNVTMAGWSTSPSLTVGGTTYTNQGWINSYVVQFDTYGNINWSYHSPVNFLLFCAAKSDNAGNVYVAGGAGAIGISIMKFDITGNVLYHLSAGYASDVAYAVNLSPQNKIYLAGAFLTSTINAGPFTLTNQGHNDLFVGELGAATGLNEMNNDLLTAWPNPVSDFLNIQIPANSKHVFSLYDAYGRLILRETISGATRVDLSEYASGIYLAVMDIDGEKTGTMKIVKE